MRCPLCKHIGLPFYTDEFFICSHCSGIFKNRAYLLDKADEISRYKDHQNDISDVHYQAFVSPITSHVLFNFTPCHIGLDFGSGTAPVISKILQDNGYTVHQFDPFFANKADLLKRTYDYIVSCEVIEHFHHPDAEFKLLHSLLKPNGALICMTHLYDETIDFKNWYYKNDRTHVFIYCRETIEFIADRFGFTNFRIDNRLIILTP